ncbi:MAG TPA: helicase RepA family protein [Vicinamibacterales bacterium]|nr:helicase RepA family protein [Vicinamibacterales bacterium]
MRPFTSRERYGIHRELLTRVRHFGARHQKDEPLVNVNEPRDRQRLNILRIDEVLDLPDPVWQIDGVIEQGALACVFGPPGDGKSFLALDWGLCIATGTPWHGRNVRRGAVIHIATEGGRGIKKRVRAWLQHHDMATADRAFMVLESVTLTGDVESLIDRINQKGIKPTLIIIDTLARSFSGDENNSADMGDYVRAAQRLQEEAGAGRCTVLLIHHTGKKEKNGARGSSALLAGVDVMIAVSKDDNDVVTVTNDKQKDDAEFRPVHLKLTPITIGTTAHRQPITSCVLEPASVLVRSAKSKALQPTHRDALLALQALGEAQTGVWRVATASKEQKGDIAPDTFEKWRKALVDDRYVEAVGDSKPARYRLTDKGASAIGAPSNASSTEPTSVSHATTPEGVAGQVVDEEGKAA